MDGWNTNVSSWDGLFFGAMLVSGSVLSIMDSSSFSLRISMNLFASLVPTHSLFGNFEAQMRPTVFDLCLFDT